MRLKEIRTGAIVEARLSRPEVHNAFDPGLIADLTEVFTRLGKDSTVRAIVLSGEGKNFCAGADIQWMRDSIEFSKEENERDAMKLHTMLETIYNCPKPTVAKVQGSVFGGGVGLMAVVDVTVASTESSFCLSETRLGILPAVIGPFVLRKIGVGGLRAYGLSAKRISADEGLRIGLVQEVVPAAELDSTVKRWTDLFLQAGPEAMKSLKSLTEKIRCASLSDSSTKTTLATATARVGPEGQEGLRAFLEKREPSWRKS